MLKLRALVTDDAEHLADWGMDEDFRAAADWTSRSREQHLRFHQDLIGNTTDERSRLAVIDGDQLVGYVDFTPDAAAPANSVSPSAQVTVGASTLVVKR